jgi:aminomethyltransferase
MTETEGKKTALYERHVVLGARMVPFAGYMMPLSYAGQIAEHEAVRTGLGLFDLSHMGEFRLTGPEALAAADRLVTNRILGIPVGQAVYSPMCREDAGIVDDLIVYNLADSVLLVVNAANLDKDEAWIREHLPAGVTFANESDETSLVAVQGPGTERFLSGFTETDLSALDTYTAVAGSVAGVPCLISRTGYTGEDGFELYIRGARAGEVWDQLLAKGAAAGMAPVGLAARDTLRFEMGYCLYGNDIDDTTTPLEAGLGWTVKLDKDAFIGKQALAAQKEQGVSRKLVGLVPDSERKIPRQGYAVVDGGETAGHITSGTFSPSLGRGLAMGYVQTSRAEAGRRLGIDIRGRVEDATVARLPFYTKGSRRAPRKRS